MIKIPLLPKIPSHFKKSLIFMQDKSHLTITPSSAKVITADNFIDKVL